MQDFTNTARQIAGSPEHYLDDTSLFTTAWGAMMAARGRRFDPSRLRAAHLIDRPEPAPEPTAPALDLTDQELARRAAFIQRAIAARNHKTNRRDAA